MSYYKLTSPIYFVICLFGFALFAILASSNAGAISSTFPDGSNMSSGDKYDPYVFVARGGADDSAVTISADPSVLRAFFPVGLGPGAKITIIDACASNPPNQVGDIGTRFSIYKETNGPASNNFNWQEIESKTNTSNCSGDDIVFNLNLSDITSSKAETYYGSDWYVIEIRADKINDNLGISNFKVSVNNGGLVTFAEETKSAVQNSSQSSSPVALWNGLPLAPDNPEATVSLRFAPDCQIVATGPKTVYLKWFDADNNATTEDFGENISFRLLRTNSLEGVANEVVISKSGSAIGGEGEYKFESFTVRKGDTFRWVWENVNRRNGLQVWLPFSDIQNNIACNYDADGSYTPFVSGADDYEKGSGTGRTINRGILINKYPCSVSIPEDVIVDTVVWSDGTTDYSFGVGNNCFGPNISPSGTSQITTNLSAAALDAFPGVGVYATYNAILKSLDGSGINTSATQTLRVFEAPFARFFGNDVKVCGDGSQNRFVYDNRTSSNQLKGSFSEYASIFKGNNRPRQGGLPNVSYEGLQSSAVNPAAWPTIYNKLLANYNGLSSVDCLADTATLALDTTIATTSTISGNPTYSAPTTIYNNGDITITDTSILTTAPGSYDSATFDADNFPIVLIYSTGDINIDASVNRIDAILVAEGEINTCVQATGNNPSAISGACRNPLKINGAVVAQAVNLQRSGGTRYKADIGGAWNDNSGGVNITKASEIIEYPWYLHFVNFESLTKDSDGGYKAYFGLPPRL